MTQNLLRTIRIPVLAVALGALALPSVSYAQNAPGRPRARQNRAQAGPQAQRADRVQEMLDQLDLSADQKAQLQPILEDSRKQVREIMQNTSDPEQRREQIRSATADIRKRINDILTPEQKTKLQELMRQQRAAATTRPAAGAGQGTGGGPIARLEEAALSLDLTPEQQTKVKDLSKEYRDEVAAIMRDNAGNADNAGAGGAGRNGEAGKQLRAAVQEYRSRLIQLLTPEQTEQFSKKVEQMPIQGKAAGGQRRRGAQQQ